ncbi:hypothetical protein [Streptomyces cavernicola]|uniref:Uncharacterized protein n=1 Tax=Streptomyces cavernicola TaxID=3043613 RepID=A0ABT6SB77_9ACTN|nr:hypothetical protein [Streptomyces sp. B-S-A6]MDI3405455.1 hypothetical protein [Streptomyces sp. B-S-A6]
MTELSTSAGPARTPSLWYGLPHGYAQIDLDPPLEGVVELLRQLVTLPGEERDRAEEVLRFYTATVGALNAQRVQSCAVGLHPDENGELVSSVLTVTTVPSSGGNAKLVIAGLAGTAGDNPDVGMRPLELPCGLGFLAEQKRRTLAPGRPPEGSDGPHMEPVWQGTVAVTGPGGHDIVLLQLVTSAVHLADDYRDVLLGIAHSLSYTDPSRTVPEAEEAPAPGSAAQQVQSDFG